ncbi:MAG TPA: nuclear transport factor 2 family protein [Nevskiaceae bacterium]|nr:nuclear transport factor 2 family protein [Nevskiaceae bacterium]
MHKHSWIAFVSALALLVACSHEQPKPESKSKAATSSESKPAKSESKSAADKAKSVTAAIDAWAAAWSKRDVDAYLDAYAPDFKPEKGKRAEWVKQRRERISGAKSIKVTIGTPQVTSSGADKATARFTQTYESDTHSDTSEKKLEFRNVDGRWLITRETSL